DSQNIMVESEFELVAQGQSPFTWELPVSLARDIEVWLDGKAQPVAIQPGGVTAQVVIPQAGRHVLRVRRWASARPDEAGSETLSLPVNALPTARIRVERPGDNLRQGELAASGLSEILPDQTRVGRLGPVDRIVLRWVRPAVPAAHPAVGSV